MNRSIQSIIGSQSSLARHIRYRMAGYYLLQLTALLGFALVLVPRHWTRILDVDPLWKRLLWIFGIPMVAAVVIWLLYTFAWRVLNARRLKKIISESEAKTSLDQATEGQTVVLKGVLRGKETATPVLENPSVGWLVRMWNANGESLGFDREYLDVSSIDQTTLHLEDQTQLSILPGPWKVIHTLDLWTNEGEVSFRNGEVVIVKGQLVNSGELSSDAAMQSNYRTVNTRFQLDLRDGWITHAKPTPPTVVNRSSGFPRLTALVVLIHGLVRMAQPAPVHTGIALGRPCDDRRYFCADRSYCGVVANRSVCTRDCETDEQCQSIRVCDMEGKCSYPRFGQVRPGTATQGQNCATALCAEGYRCINARYIHNTNRPRSEPDEMCVKNCTQDSECSSGTICIRFTDDDPNGFCDQFDLQLEISQLMLAMRRGMPFPQRTDAGVSSRDSSR